MDDVQDEAAKHRLQERIDSAVKAALDNQQNRSSKSEVWNLSTHFSKCMLTCLDSNPEPPIC